MAVDAVYSIRIRDFDGNAKSGLFPVDFDDPPTLGEIQQTADDIFDVLDPVIGGTIESCTVSLVLTVDSEYTGKTPTANHEVGVGANFSWLQSNGRSYTQYIPTFLNSLMPGGAVNTASGAGATFKTEALDGWGGDTGSQQVSDEGLAIGALRDAYKTSRK